MDSTNMDWYDNLDKPKIVPPKWVFSVVWIILYFLLIMSAVLYGFRVRKFNWVVVIFLINIGLNVCWATIFFKYRKLMLAFVSCIFLLLTSMYCLLIFFWDYPLVGFLYLPYVIWLCLATYFSGYIMYHNS